MIFGLFSKKKKLLTPLESGEKFELEIPGEKQSRFLYGRVVKVSKKKNIFVQFTSKDKGENLVVGTEGQMTALKSEQKIQFQTRFLHQNEKIFIFSPPETTASVKIHSAPDPFFYSISLPIHYRAMASPHTQKGEAIQFAWDSLVFSANLPIPIGTLLNLEIALPHLDRPIQIKEKVADSLKSQKDLKKYDIRISLEELGTSDKEEILWFVLLKSSTDQPAAVKGDRKETGPLADKGAGGRLPPSKEGH